MRRLLILLVKLSKLAKLKKMSRVNLVFALFLIGVLINGECLEILELLRRFLIEFFLI